MAIKKRDHGIGMILTVAAGSLVAAIAMAATAVAQPAAPAPAAAAPAAAATAPAAAAAGAAAQAVGPVWIKLCSPDPTTKKNLCLVQQETYADTGQFIVSATIRSIQDSPMMQFIVGLPPGLLIQPGVQVQVDGGKMMPVAYSICFPNTCFASLDITADFVKTIRNGKQLTVGAVNQATTAITFPISLSGFGKVYDGAGIDPNTAAGQTTVNALTASLQLHANQARQALITQQQQRPQ